MAEFRALECIARDAVIRDYTTLNYSGQYKEMPLQDLRDTKVLEKNARAYLCELLQFFPILEMCERKTELIHFVYERIEDTKECLRSHSSGVQKNYACGNRDNLRQILLLLGEDEKTRNEFGFYPSY